MILPQCALLRDSPCHIWGVGRLIAPVLLVKMEWLGSHDGTAMLQPQVWPPDAPELSHGRLDFYLERLQDYFEHHQGNGPCKPASADIACTLPLPNWLVVDDPLLDFTAVIDTERHLLWVVEVDEVSLHAVHGWRMHPDSTPRLELPAARREAAAFWEQWSELREAIEDNSLP